MKVINPLVIEAIGAKWDNLSTKYGKSTVEIVGNVNSGDYDA